MVSKQKITSSHPAPIKWIETGMKWIGWKGVGGCTRERWKDVCHHILECSTFFLIYPHRKIAFKAFVNVDFHYIFSVCVFILSTLKWYAKNEKWANILRLAWKTTMTKNILNVAHSISFLRFEKKKLNAETTRVQKCSRKWYVAIAKLYCPGKMKNANEKKRSELNVIVQTKLHEAK